MPGFQKAREALGLRLRELRRDARLTGRRLAQAHGWHPTKISKIEGGKQTPSDADLEAWAASCGVPEQTADLIASLRSLETMYVEYRRMFGAGMAGRQLSFGELEESAAFIRNFEVVFIPGLAQTPEYARYRLAEAITQDGAADDLDEAVAARMQRQQLLYRAGKRFHFVVAESALRLRLCPPEVLAGQLDRLVTLSTMRTIRFGVIPLHAVYPVAPVHGFWIFDDRHVVAEVLAAELNVVQPSEIAVYLSAFSQLAEMAVYGPEARALITDVLVELLASEP